MTDSNHLLLLDSGLAALVLFDLRRTLKTGRAHIRRGGTVTREHQPARYWRYVYGDYVVLAFCAAVFIWATYWPDSVR